MSIHTTYQFRHYRRSPEGRELLWASTLGEVLALEHSREHDEALSDQGWIDNALADQGEQAMLDLFFRAGATPTFYLALYDDTLEETDTPATALNEVSGTGYARIELLRNTTDFPTLALDGGDYKVTSAIKTFTAGGAWTAATQLALVSSDSGTGGSLWAWAALSATRTLQNGDSLDVSLAVKLA